MRCQLQGGGWLGKLVRPLRLAKEEVAGGETTVVRTTNHSIPKCSSLQRGQTSGYEILRKFVPIHWMSKIR